MIYLKSQTQYRNHKYRFIRDFFRQPSGVVYHTSRDDDIDAGCDMPVETEDIVFPKPPAAMNISPLQELMFIFINELLANNPFTGGVCVEEDLYSLR